ncbi:MAG: plasmid mobilization protein [Phycisphaerales bacterium]
MKLASEYQFVIVRDPDMGYFGRTVEMPFAMSDGHTVAKCMASTLEATASGIATMLERGETPPSPAREGKRDQQVNLRLTADEKMTLEGFANREGFRSLSDFIRTAALRHGR